MDDSPKARRSSARALARGLVELDEACGFGVVDRLVVSVFMIIFVPAGLVVLVVSAMAFAALMQVVGVPSGTLGAVVGVVWFGLTIALVAIAFVKLFRRLPRRVRLAVSEPAALLGLEELPEDSPREQADPATPTLAELDARLAPHDPPL